MRLAAALVLVALAAGALGCADLTRPNELSVVKPRPAAPPPAAEKPAD